MKVFGRVLKRAFFFLVFVLPFAAEADVLEDVLDRGKLQVGVSLFTPWAMKDKSGELIGFEIDVANKLAREMGVDLELKVYPQTEIITALNKGEIDVVIAGMGITPKRALQMNFTLPYAESGVGLATNTKMTAGISDLRELNQPQVIVAVVAKTLGSDVAKLVFDNTDLRVVATREEAEQAVLNGKVHAYVGGLVETTFLALQHPETIDNPLAKPLLVSVAGMGVKKREQEMLNFLNAWITARAADKWLSATQKYWFSSLKWRDRVEP